MMKYKEVAESVDIIQLPGLHMRLYFITTVVFFSLFLHQNSHPASFGNTDSSGGHSNQGTSAYNARSQNSSSSNNDTYSSNNNSSSTDYLSKNKSQSSDGKSSSSTDRFSSKKGSPVSGYINLPNISGYEVASNIQEKENNNFRRVKIVEVMDGDTFKCIIDGKEVAIKLYGIDAPEKGQTFSVMSSIYFKQLISGKNVRIRIVENDGYGRPVALVYADDINVNETLVKNGAAWVCPQYCKLIFCEEWNGYQHIAKSLKMFLWDDGMPIPPWEYGHR